VDKRLKLKLELMAENVEQLRRDLDKLSDSIYNNIYQNSSCTEEKKEINKILDYISGWKSRVDDVSDEVLRESRETKEGVLDFDSYSKKYFVDTCGSLLSCGSFLELYLYDKLEDAHIWMRGRVEHSSEIGGYYFKSNEIKNTKLAAGMKARKRLK